MASKKQHGARTLEQDLLTANSSGSIAGKKMTSTKSPFLLKDLNEYLDPQYSNMVVLNIHTCVI